jgi:Cu/Ag efflux pump CusA
MDTSFIGKGLIAVGVIIALIGVVLVFLPKLPFLGRLPGDIFIDTGNTKIFAPIATSLLLSIVLTVILNLFFNRK